MNMIRIQTANDRRGTTIALDGQLVGEYVGEVEASIQKASEQRKNVHLFLRDVSHIDETGHSLLSRVAAQGVELSAGEARVRVEAITPNIFRVHYSPQGNFPPDHSFAVVSNILRPVPNVSVQQSGDSVTINAGAVQAKVFRSPVRIAFLDE